MREGAYYTRPFSFKGGNFQDWKLHRYNTVDGASFTFSNHAQPEISHDSQE